MRPEDFQEGLRKKPFQPFRIHLSDGTRYDLRHPELVMVGRSIALVGEPAADTEVPIFDRYETISLIHITRLEPIGKPKSKSS